MKGERRKVGQKGQVVIPKEIRDKAGLREGVEVIVSLRDGQVVIERTTPVTVDYVSYFISTYSKKLEKEVDVKRIIQEEYLARAGLP